MWEPSVIVEQKLKVHFKVIITKTFTHSDSVWIVSGQSCVVFLILWREPLCSVVGCRVHSAAASFILTLSLPPTFILTAWWKQEAAFRPAEQSKREDLQLTMTWHTGWNTRRRNTDREGKQERAGSGLTMTQHSPDWEWKQEDHLMLFKHYTHMASCVLCCRQSSATCSLKVEELLTHV